MVQSTLDFARLKKVHQSNWHMEHGMYVSWNDERKTFVCWNFYYKSTWKGSAMDRLTNLELNQKFETNLRTWGVQITWKDKKM